jgi:hypothetical protein
MRIVWTTLFYLSLCGVTPGVHAATIPVEASATGSIVERAYYSYKSYFDGTEYTSINPLEKLQDDFYVDYSSYSSYRNTSVGYLVFDLSGVPRDAQNVTLELDVAYANNANPNLTIHALDPATAQDLIANPVGSQSESYTPAFGDPPPVWTELASQYSAIRGGAHLGVLSQLGPLDGTFSIDLTSTALGLVNGTDGLFALGLTWTPTLGDLPYAGLDKLVFNAGPRLILGDSVSAVPVPAAAWLFGTALMGLMGMARRHRT